jgi:hypothetical protein
MFNFVTDYFILIFVASVGVIQAAASIGGLNGLLVFKSPYVARTLGVGLVLAAFIWFFSTGERNINDYSGGLDANEQAIFFFLGVLAGGVFTFLLTSIVNAGMNGSEPSPEDGMDALKEASYFSALAHNLDYWRRNWRTQIKRYFFG